MTGLTGNQATGWHAAAAGGGGGDKSQVLVSVRVSDHCSKKFPILREENHPSESPSAPGPDPGR